MLKFIFSFIAIVLLHSINLYSQNKDSVHVLSEVSVTAFKDKYATGSKVIKIDSALLSNVSGKSLTDLLTFYMPIYIKQDAGGLATIKFRGSSPDHTAIMFSGININSLTLGHSNLSDIPNFLFDDINVQFGGSGSLHGSDAIGGSINLDTKVNWNKGFNVGLQQDIGSFGNYFSGIKTSFSNKRLFVSIKVFRHEKENNFPFINLQKVDIVTRKYKLDTTRNASFLNTGILHEFSYKISSKIISHYKIWLEDNYHEIQPIMSANDINNSPDNLKTNHIRVVGGIKYLASQYKLNFDLGYFKDYQEYNKNQSEIISTDSYISNINYFNNNILNGDLNVGISFKQIKPKVYAYIGNIKENRIDVFASYKKTFIKRLELAVNLRDAYVSDYKTHFTPSIGAEYKLMDNLSHTLSLKSSFAHSYKVPTFNQRFWGRQGNPNILPENGNNYEVGMAYSFHKKSVHIKTHLNVYQMFTKNLIQWVNIGDWVPYNVQDVNNKGCEFAFESSYKIYKFNINHGISYSYTKAIVEKSYNETIFPIGQQLAYTPEHMGNVFLKIGFKTWEAFGNINYIGERHTLNNHIEEPLEAYYLVNAYLGKSIIINKKHKLNAQLMINNILNIDYQNQKDYAMPGTNYLLSIKYFFNN